MFKSKEKKKLEKYKKIIENSDLFDSKFYLKTYRDARLASETLLDHFVKYGLKEDRKPNEWFDPKWYKEYYEDIKNSKEIPFIHYIVHGMKEFRFANESEKKEYNALQNSFDAIAYRNSYEDLQKLGDDFDFLWHYVHFGKREGRKAIYKTPKSTTEATQNNQENQFGPILHNPLVSIISVNYNGSADLPIFLESVAQQSYTNFELIIVDNGSKDNSKEIVEQYKHKFQQIKFIETNQNLGFAAGNNYALPYCNGELLCLLNIDTRADQDWLKELVDAMSLDGSCAAVASKTLFFERFQDLEISSKGNFAIKLNSLIESLKYKKYFLRVGKIENNFIISHNNTIVISLPVQDDNLLSIICKKLTNNISGLHIKAGKNPAQYYKTTTDNVEIKIDFSLQQLKSASYIINNAGSMSNNNMPYDRGYGEYDTGQYNKKDYIDFFCGVSVLLRRIAFVEREIFIPEFFAYYEDSELSYWLREQGYSIGYVPSSLVYHKHSSSTDEGSDLWKLLVSRSKKIYQYITTNHYSIRQAEKLFLELSHIEEKQTFTAPELKTKLINYDKELFKRIQTTREVIKSKKVIGIYNSFWNTLGGGEKHALSFAVYLQKFAPVYLISETDFDIALLENYYNCNLNNCYKIIEPNFHEKFTEKFDIFINSTYCSNLKSKAKKSYYIVSFPHKDIDKALLNNYIFLYNSYYTKKWSEKYWGEKINAKVVYPLIKADIEENKNFKKEKIILSVGRYFKEGHSKNQHIIARAFKGLVDQHPELQEWRIVFIGSLNENNENDVSYVKQIQSELEGTKYSIYTNIDKHTLNEFYSKAYVYVHATGYGKDKENEPEKFEHFGITVLESLLHECYPIVYKYGGPSETLKQLQINSFFKTEEELIEKMYQLMRLYPKEIHKQYKDQLSDFTQKNDFETNIKNIIGGV